MGDKKAGKRVVKVRSVFFLGGGDEIGEMLGVRMRTQRIRLLDIIQEITDPAKLPEYLSDEDLDIVEAAELKLRELTGVGDGC